MTFKTKDKIITFNFVSGVLLYLASMFLILKFGAMNDILLSGIIVAILITAASGFFLYDSIVKKRAASLILNDEGLIVVKDGVKELVSYSDIEDVRYNLKTKKIYLVRTKTYNLTQSLNPENEELFGASLLEKIEQAKKV